MVIEIKGISLNYEVFGEGKPLLLLHGWEGSINAMAPIWQYMKNKYQVYVIDFPGQNNGSSSLNTPWGVPEYADMVLSFMEKLNIVHPNVIAHSFGGRVAIYLAAKREDIFHKIVLVDSAGVKPKKTLKQSIQKGIYQIGKKVIKLISSPSTYEKRMANYRRKFSSSDYNSLTSDVMRQTFSQVVNLDLTSYLSDIKNPTLIMWGKQDKDTPLYMGKIMEKTIPDAGLVVLENAGHFSYLDATQKFNKIVDHFFSDTDK